MAVLGQFCQINMKTVFTFPLGPLTWSLSDAFGLPRKTKQNLFSNLVERFPENAASIYGGMAMLQRLKPSSRATFSVAAKKVFDIVTSNNSKCIDVVFDVYQDISVKNAERAKRSSESEVVRYKNIMPGYQIKTWKKFLTIYSNKSELIHFLVCQWKKAEFREKLGERTMFVTMQDQCCKLDSISCDKVPDLAVTVKNPIPA